VLVGEAYAGDVVGEVLTSWVSRRIRTRELSDQAAAIIRLYGGTNAVRNSTIAFDIAGNAAVAWPEGAESRVGMAYIMRQQACIGGGTTEMSRNVISERVLGMPREQTRDKDIPFRDVPRSAPTH
jgi:alkylation response protein AidB-like acyl-CoA dehydrogenase